MTDKTRLLILSTFLALPLLICAEPSSAQFNCGEDVSATDVVKAQDATAQQPSTNMVMAESWVSCLGDPDPAIRDGLAYQQLTDLLRSGNLRHDEQGQLRGHLLAMLESDDPDGFTAPFAALVLSEIARTDRVSPYMTAEERSQFVKAAADYVSGVDDYRGYSDSEGWRHGVAHGADWLMQLTLNPALTADDAALILDAVRTQVPAANGHAYIHGEAGRLARPVLFIALTGQHGESDWTDWLAPLLDPAPMDSWNEAYTSEVGLARLHNVKSFLQALYVSASVSSNDAVKGLLPPVTEALRSLP